MLQKLKYDAINFEKYQTMKQKFMNPNFHPEEVRELDLSKYNSSALPPLMCLKLMSKLVVLNLSKNHINHFDGHGLAQACPLLMKLDLSDNEIECIDDINELGLLTQLTNLDFSGNPVCSVFIRTQLLQMLLYPQKYEKYQPVKILTATYTHVPNFRRTNDDWDEVKRLTRICQKTGREIIQGKDVDVNNRVNKYDHKNTLLKYNVLKCPNDRKTRFAMLEVLNKQTITRLDIERASATDNVNDVLVNAVQYKFKMTKSVKEYIDEKRKSEQSYQVGKMAAKLNKKSKMEQQHVLTKKDSLNQQLQHSFGRTPLEQQHHDMLIHHYERKIMKSLQDVEPLMSLPTQNKKEQDGAGEEDLKYLSELDQINIARQKQAKNNPKLKALEVWDKPRDYLSRKATFKISIQKFKKQEQAYKQHKRELLDKRKRDQLRYLEKIKALRTDQVDLSKKRFFKGEQLEDIQKMVGEEIESDKEVRAMFKQKPWLKKPKLDLVMNNEQEFGTSESDLEVGDASSSDDSEVCVKIDQQNDLQTDKQQQKKYKNASTKGGTFSEIAKKAKKQAQNVSVSSEVSESAQEDSSDEENNVSKQKSKLKTIVNLQQVPKDQKDKTSQLSPFPSPKSPNKQRGKDKFKIQVEDLLPSEAQGLPEQHLFDILADPKSIQFKLIMDVKGLLEESKTVLDESQKSRALVNIHGGAIKGLMTQVGINAKKHSSYGQVLDMLAKQDPFHHYTDKDSLLLRDIIYYANDYSKADEPRINEKEMEEQMKDIKNISDVDLDKGYRTLEILDNIKSQQLKISKHMLKRVEQKEIEKAEENAVLAAHYLRLKKYYKEGIFDKYLKKLNLHLGDEKIGGQGDGQAGQKERDRQDKKRLQRVPPITYDQATKKRVLSKHFSEHVGQLHQLKSQLPASKHVEIAARLVKGFVPAMSFEQMMERNLRKMQSDFAKNENVQLNTEERMIRFAMEFKENAKKQEALFERIEQIIENKEVRQKLDIFWEEELESQANRNDPEYCFKFYVKLLRDGKL